MPLAAVMSALARSFIAGEQTAEAAHARAAYTLGHSGRWLQNLSAR